MSDIEIQENKIENVDLQISGSKVYHDGESNHLTEERNKDKNDIDLRKDYEQELGDQNIRENELTNLSFTDVTKAENEEHKSDKQLENSGLVNSRINGTTDDNISESVMDIKMSDLESCDKDTKPENQIEIKSLIPDDHAHIADSSNNNQTISFSTQGDKEMKNGDHLENNNIIDSNRDPINFSDYSTDDINKNKIHSDELISNLKSVSELEKPDYENKVNSTDTNEISMTENSDDKITDADNCVDILGNGLLKKRVITHGLGRETRPTHGDSVTIQYKGWNVAGEVIDSGEVSFVLGDGDMIQAFDLGICLAERHEEFELKTDARFAYGSYGWEPLVKPNEALTYNIKLLRVDDAPDYTALSYQDRMKAADFKRERGNYLYRREEYSLAVNSYSRAIKIIETDPDYKRANTDPTKADMYDLFVKVTNNLAAAQLKLESYDNVIETCNTILNYDALNVKALFRKGKSLTMKGNYDEAIPILKRALELENSKLIASEIQRCYQLKRAEDEQRARVCRRMFGSGAKETPDKNQLKKSSWKRTVIKFSPYLGAVLILIGSIYMFRR